jgi:hypothetical protein
MAALDMEKAFPIPKGKSHLAPMRNYDVRISLNKSGGERFSVRFGLINKAADILGDKPFIEVSDVEYTKDRLYFISHNEKHHNNIHTLSINKKERRHSCYFAITPSEKAEKLYRSKWIGKLCNLLYDEENSLYYIENKEDKQNESI